MPWAECLEYSPVISDVELQVDQTDIPDYFTYSNSRIRLIVCTLNEALLVNPVTLYIYEGIK